MGLIETMKDVAELVQKADNIELYRQIMMLQTEAFSLVEENHVLREQVRSLTDQLALKVGVVYDALYCWVVKADGTKDGPYCPACYGADGKLVYMPRMGETSEHRYCGICIHRGARR